MAATATFSNGQKAEIANSKAGYTHAFSVASAGKSGPTGFAKSRANAEKAASAMHSKLCKLWPGRVFEVEVVEVKN